MFVEIFAGAGQITKYWRRNGYAALALDIVNSHFHDLSDPALIQLLRGWILGGVVLGIWIATPCLTFSRARRFPDILRSNELPNGLPNLAPHNQQKLETGNRLASASFSIAKFAISKGLPVAIENPYSSFLWRVPAFCSLAEHVSFKHAAVDMCQYGTPWRKRTRLALWHIQRSVCFQLCSGRGRCSRTRVAHVQLEGARRTKLAQEYPAAFAKFCAKMFIDEIVDHRNEVLFSVSMR